jgi:hypothetical protein
MSLFASLRSRKEAARLVQAGAISLIARFGDNAYYEARDRVQRSTVIDTDRPRGHWTRVKIEIAKRQWIEIGRSGADQTANRGKLLSCGEQTKRTENRLRRPALFRNGGRNVSTTLRQPAFEFKLGFSAFGLAG